MGGEHLCVIKKTFCCLVHLILSKSLVYEQHEMNTINMLAQTVASIPVHKASVLHSQPALSTVNPL